MKNKVLLIAIGLMVTNYYVERYIFYIKNAYYTYTTTHKEELSKNKNSKIPGSIEATILENNFETIIVNKGKNHGIKVNQVVTGTEGFIGIVEKVEDNISIVQTFWKIKSNFIIVNGLNSYGYVRSNGYHLTIESKQSKNTFSENDDLYIAFPHTKLIAFGKVSKYRSHLEPLPLENVTKIKTVYVLL